MEDWGDDDWGDDVIEECVQLASQAHATRVSSPPKTIQQQKLDSSLNSSNVNKKSTFEFKDPNKSKVMCPPPNNHSTPCLPNSSRLVCNNLSPLSDLNCGQSDACNIF